MRYSIVLPDPSGATLTALDRESIEHLLSGLRGGHELLWRYKGCQTVEECIVAGLRAARGEVVVVIEPGGRYAPSEIPKLVARLARTDFACGRRRRTGLARWWARLARLPRWLLLGLENRDPTCLFWAARREVFFGVQLVPAMVRYLPSLVARRGFRVDNVYVEEQPHTAGSSYRLSRPRLPRARPATLWSAWRACTRSAKADAADAAGHDAAQGRLDAASSSDISGPFRAKSA